MEATNIQSVMAADGGLSSVASVVIECGRLSRQKGFGIDRGHEM